MTSRILGLVREQVLATFFGASDAMDAYRIGFRIPNLLPRPVRRRRDERGVRPDLHPPSRRTAVKESAWRLGNLRDHDADRGHRRDRRSSASCSRNRSSRCWPASYAAVPGKLELTITLTRIMLPVADCSSRWRRRVMGMLNSLHHFFIPALSPAMFNVVTIAVQCSWCRSSCRWLADAGRHSSPMHWAPIIVIGSTVLGGVAQLALQWPTLRARGIPLPARPRLEGSGTATRAAADGSRDARPCRHTGECRSSTCCWPPARAQGAQSWLELAFRLMYLPIGLFGVSIATADASCRLAARRGAAMTGASARHRSPTASSLMMMLNVPATVGLIVLSVPIVRVIFEHGRFTPSRHRSPRLPHCASTPSAWSATPSSASPRQPSTRSVATASRSSSAWSRWW